MKINQLNVWNRFFSKNEQLALAGLVLVGIVLRVINALQTQLWRDEAYIIITGQNNTFIDLLFQNHWDKLHPPFYFIFIHFWQMLSIDPFFLRLPSIIATVATLYLLPILAKNLFPRNNSFPFFVLFFYVFSHTQISLNMVARPYPFVILAITISLIIFFNILDAHKFSLKNTVLFGITNLLIFFIDYSGIWLILSYGIFGIIFIAVYYKKNKSKTLHITYALFSTGIFCLIWLPIFIKNLKYNLNFAHRTLETSFTEGTYFDSTIWRLPFFSGIIAKESDFLVGFFQWHAMQLAVVFVSIGLFGLILIFARQRLKGSFILVATLFPLIITFIYSIYAYVIFHGRFLLTFNYFIIFGYTFISFIIYKYFRYFIFIILFFWLLISFQTFQDFITSIRHMIGKRLHFFYMNREKNLKKQLLLRQANPICLPLFNFMSSLHQ